MKTTIIAFVISAIVLIVVVFAADDTGTTGHPNKPRPAATQPQGDDLPTFKTN